MKDQMIGKENMRIVRWYVGLTLVLIIGGAIHHNIAIDKAAAEEKLYIMQLEECHKKIKELKRDIVKLKRDARYPEIDEWADGYEEVMPIDGSEES